MKTVLDPLWVPLHRAANRALRELLTRRSTSVSRQRHQGRLRLSRPSVVLIMWLLLCCGVMVGIAHGHDLEEVVRLAQHMQQLYHQGRYTEAIGLAERTLALAEKVFGPNHPVPAGLLSALAEMYRMAGQATRALP